ncbi:hypothetical protein [Streptomyces sp. NPDC027717]|uniref:hypothetical protein n=1 Tax=Streptomyces sp. NPDC027717 TaxID=3155765 RepID=UPI0033C8A309
MSTQAQKILAIARDEKGYHEGRKGGHWDNDQKYSDETPGLEWSDFQAWCATFVSWCAMKAGLADLQPAAGHGPEHRDRGPRAQVVGGSGMGRLR